MIQLPHIKRENEMNEKDAKRTILALKIISTIGLLALTVYLSDAIAGTVDPFTVVHKDGYEVTVIHVGDTPSEIEERCGSDTYERTRRKTIRTHIRGCAVPPKRYLATCEIWAPNPKHDFEGTFAHEVRHCKGWKHGEDWI